MYHMPVCSCQQSDLQRSRKTDVVLASIELRYRYAATADLTKLLDDARKDAALPASDALYTNATSLKACILQRLRDSGTSFAQAATVACNKAAPYSISSGPISIMMPASADASGAHMLQSPINIG